MKGLQRLSRRWVVVLALWTVLVLIAPAVIAWLLEQYPGYSAKRFPTGTVASGYVLVIGTVLLVLLSPFLAWSFGQTPCPGSVGYVDRLGCLARAWWRTWGVSGWFIGGLVASAALSAVWGGLTVSRILVGAVLVLLVLGAVLAIQIAIRTVLRANWLAVSGAVVVTGLLVAGPVALVFVDVMWASEEGRDCDGNGLPDTEGERCPELILGSGDSVVVTRNAVQTWWLATAAPAWVVADGTPKVSVPRPRTSVVPLPNGLDPVYAISEIGRLFRAEDEVTTWQTSEDQWAVVTYEETRRTWPTGLAVLAVSGLGSLLLAALVPGRDRPHALVAGTESE
jgi:hypothetical protein